MADPAVFVDRDGTLMEDSGYLVDPGKIRLLPGVVLALKALSMVGFKIIVVTNQSAVARGMGSEDDVQKVNDKLRDILGKKAARIDAVYSCPYHPEGTVEEYSRESELRKPSPGMLLQAAGDLNLDLKSSWMIGDSLRDIEAGKTAGCRSILIGSAEEAEEKDPEGVADYTAANLVMAAKVIVSDKTGESVQKEPDTVPVPETQEEDEMVEINEAENIEDQNDGESESFESGDEPDVDPEREEEEGDEYPEEENEEETEGEEEEEEEEGDLTENREYDEDSRIRREILSHVRQMAKIEEHEEFSLLNLLGGLSQVVVLPFLVLALYEAMALSSYDSATFWGIVAAIFQLMSLTMYTIVSRSK